MIPEHRRQLENFRLLYRSKAAETSGKECFTDAECAEWAKYYEAVRQPLAAEYWRRAQTKDEREYRLELEARLIAEKDRKFEC